jgi:hypothetical protein
MCRPSCCDNSGGQATGIVAVALILIGTLIVAKIGPIVARIVHVVLEMLRIAGLTAGAVLALAVLTWLAVMTVRWWLRHRVAWRQAIVQSVDATVRQNLAAGDQPACLACGGTGMVLRAISGGSYQPWACPVCERAEWAG